MNPYRNALLDAEAKWEKEANAAAENIEKVRAQHGTYSGDFEGSVRSCAAATRRRRPCAASTSSSGTSPTWARRTRTTPTR